MKLDLNKLEKYEMHSKFNYFKIIEECSDTNRLMYVQNLNFYIADLINDSNFRIMISVTFSARNKPHPLTNTINDIKFEIVIIENDRNKKYPSFKRLSNLNRCQLDFVFQEFHFFYKNFGLTKTLDEIITTIKNDKNDNISLIFIEENVSRINNLNIVNDFFYLEILNKKLNTKPVLKDIAYNRYFSSMYFDLDSRKQVIEYIPYVKTFDELKNLIEINHIY